MNERIINNAELRGSLEKFVHGVRVSRMVS